MSAVGRSPASARSLFRPPNLGDLVLLAPVGVTVAGIVVKETMTPAAWQTSGRMVPVRGRNVHVVGQFSDGPTVVLESDVGQPLSIWRWVRDALQADGSTSVLAYERPGIGLSQADPATLPRHHPEQLMAVLEAAGASPPYILVGHAAGGLLTRMFAARYPEAVAGMVFVDPAHPDQDERSAVQHRRRELLDERLRRLARRARFGLPAEPAVARAYEGLPGTGAAAAAAMATTMTTLRTARRELALGRTTWAAAARQLSHVERPVAVVSAGSTVSADPVLLDLHRELAALSATSSCDVVAGADHLTVLTDRDSAHRVVAAIEWVRSSSRTGATGKEALAS